MLLMSHSADQLQSDHLPNLERCPRDRCLPNFTPLHEISSGALGNGTRWSKFCTHNVLWSYYMVQSTIYRKVSLFFNGVQITFRRTKDRWKTVEWTYQVQGWLNLTLDRSTRSLPIFGSHYYPGVWGNWIGFYVELRGPEGDPIYLDPSELITSKHPQAKTISPA